MDVRKMEYLVQLRIIAGVLDRIAVRHQEILLNKLSSPNFLHPENHRWMLL